jgi:hypothetical protein
LQSLYIDHKKNKRMDIPTRLFLILLPSMTAAFILQWVFLLFIDSNLADLNNTIRSIISFVYKLII